MITLPQIGIRGETCEEVEETQRVGEPRGKQQRCVDRNQRQQALPSMLPHDQQKQDRRVDFQVRGDRETRNLGPNPSWPIQHQPQA